ncbi:MAG TPA: histone deacetylase [Polyangiales bacterium]|nr:histone deacetylase [Polyangiales bacterium]
MSTANVRPSGFYTANAPLAVAIDATCVEHVAPPNHDEDPERYAAAERGFERSKPAASAERLKTRPVTLDELARVHTHGFIEKVLATRGLAGWFDPDTYYSPKTADVALTSTGAALALTEALLGDTIRQGFGLWRPPGHHSCADRALGFCLFNHVAVAARHAQKLGAKRILILDWDVHHGNGTEEIFAGDPSVLYISTHQGRPQYPETGAYDEVGKGEGRGYTVNLPLSIGADGATYAAAFERVILPISEQYKPDLTLVSAGYDAHLRDPLGGMCLNADDYAWMTQALVHALGGRNQARVGFYLEGGYDRTGLADSITSTLDALHTRETMPDPRQNARPLRKRHAEELAAIERVQRVYWNLP